MARVWIELDGEQAGRGPARVLVARLSRDSYVAVVLIGTRVQTLIITGRKLTPSELLALGRPPPATPQARRDANKERGRGSWPATPPCGRLLARGTWSAASLRTRPRWARTAASAAHGILVSLPHMVFSLPLILSRAVSPDGCVSGVPFRSG